MALSKQEFLNKFAVRRYDECHGIRLQSLTELEQSKLESMWGKRYRKTEEIDPVMRRELVCLCAIDAEGKRLFENNEVDTLGEVDGGIITDIYRKCRKLCRMDEDEDTEATAKKSSETTDSD